MRSSMKWKVLAVGKPSLPWAKTAADDYLERLGRVARVDLLTVREGIKTRSAGKLLELSEGSYRVVLDERGRSMRSSQFAQWIQQQEVSGRKAISVILGGANGHEPEVTQAADETWTLSPMTLQHEMALVLFLEQLYRAYTIMRGEPYHRE